MSINITKILSRLMPGSDFRKTILRFPLSAACSALIFVLIFAANHDLIDLDDEMAGKLIALSACGFFWFGAAKLIAENRSWSFWKYLACSAPVFAALLAKIFFLPHWDLFLIFAVPALLAFLMVAPSIGKDRDDACFWHFNRPLWTGAAVAILASWILGGGISATLASVHFLFDVKIDEKIYADVWALTSLIFCPLYTLSWVPRDFSYTGEGFIYPRWIAFIMNWIKAPLIAVYFLILYAYVAKILIQGQLPHGNVSWMVTGFAGCGIVAYMVAWPLRESGTPLLRLVLKYFWRSMMVPVLLLFVAIGVRIHEYGVTEQRYLMAMAAVFFAIVTGLFVVFGDRMKIRAVPAVLACLLALSSFGPWGAVAVSGKSQFHRLETLLVKHSILQAGGIPMVSGNRIVPHTGDKIPFEDEKSISSIVEYLSGTKRGDMLRPWFEKPGGTWKFVGYYETLQSMGLNYISQWDTVPKKDGAFSFYARTGHERFDTSGYDAFLVQDYYINQGSTEKLVHEFSATDQLPALKIFYDKEGNVDVDLAGFDRLSFNLASHGSEFFASGSPVVLEARNETLRGRIIILSASGKSDEKGFNLNQIRYYLLLDYKE